MDPAPPERETHSAPIASEIQRQEACLARLLEWIRAVDGKTPTVVGLCITMLGVIAAIAPKAANLTPGSAAILALGSIPLLGSLGWCVGATFPHTEGPEASLIYFGGICERQLPAYVVALEARSDAEYLRDLNAQCHRNAQIAQAKFARIQTALLWLFGGTPLWLLACYFLYKG